MTEKFEHSTPTVERVPTYDSFGDPDEALQWIVDRIILRTNPHGLEVWWTSPDRLLDGLSPEAAWHQDPNRLIKLVATY